MALPPEDAKNEARLPVTKAYDTIRPGIDAHARWCYVARQVDGAPPQPVQKMDLA